MHSRFTERGGSARYVQLIEEKEVPTIEGAPQSATFLIEWVRKLFFSLILRNKD